MLRKFAFLITLVVVATKQQIHCQNAYHTVAPIIATNDRPNIRSKANFPTFRSQSRIIQDINNLPPRDPNDTWGVVLGQIGYTIITALDYVCRRKVSHQTSAPPETVHHSGAHSSTPEQNAPATQLALAEQQIGPFGRHIFESQQELLETYQYESAAYLYEHPDDTSPSNQRLARRAASIRATLRQPGNYQEMRYEIKDRTRALLNTYIPQSIYDMEKLIGNKIQHTLHQECIDIFDGIAKNQVAFDEQHFTEAIMHATDAGQSYNRHGYITQAIEQIDFGWQLQEIVLGALWGAYTVSARLDEMGHHPINTVVDLVTGCGHLVYFIGNTLIKLGYARCQMGVLCNKRSSILEQMCEDIGQLGDAFQAQSLREKSRDITALCIETAIGVEAAILSKCSLYIGALAREGLAQANYLKKATDIVRQEKYLLRDTTHNRFLCDIPVVIEEALEHAKKIIPIAQEEAVLARAGGASISNNRVVNAAKKNGGGNRRHIEYITGHCNEHWPATAKRISKRITDKHFSVGDIDNIIMSELCVEHIAKGNYNRSGRFVGLHHDVNSALKRSGVVQKTKDLGHGFYEATIHLGSETIEGKTFFPDVMTLDDIATLIETAFKSPLKEISKKPDGLVIVENQIISKIYLKIVITANKNIISVYPTLKKSSI